MKAIALFSGGLDSMLVTKILENQGIKTDPYSFTSFFFNEKQAKNSAKILGKKLFGNKINFKVISKNKGYISILYVENNGKVGVILPNATIKQKLIYPSKKDEEALIAYNPYQKTISEMYVCIYSPTKLDLSEFENIDDDLLDESNYHFDKLLDIIQKIHLLLLR